MTPFGTSGRIIVMIHKTGRLAWLPLLILVMVSVFSIFTPRVSADHSRFRVVVLCENGDEFPAHESWSDDELCTNSNGGVQVKAIGRVYVYSCHNGSVIRNEAFFDNYEESLCANSVPADEVDPDVNAPTNINTPQFVKSDCQGQNISGGQPEELPDGEKNPDHCGILDFLVIFINILSALIGIVIVGSIIYGGIQYSTAGSDPQKVSAAKNRIRNAIIAFIFFLFSYTILNFLVPGGVF